MTKPLDDQFNHASIKNNLKRKRFSKGNKMGFKRFKKMPKYVKDKPENIIARQKVLDAYHFTDSEPEDDLGMGLDIGDLPILGEDMAEVQKKHFALTQDNVSPLFNQDTYDERKLDDGLTELGYSGFRPNQKEAIKRILFGRSTLFVSPTGSGKSLCYQLPAYLYWTTRRYITIVVSPLISLMEDQMVNFPATLTPVCIHSSQNKSQRAAAIQKLVNFEAQVVFMSPEAIIGGLLELNDLKNLPPVGFVCIDEAHCLSEWSHNFRPAYLQFFRILREQMSIKTFLALTATANKATSFSIAKSLIINPETDVLGTTVVPKNLILSVSVESNKERALLELLKTPTFIIMPSIIIYCNTRNETEAVASMIRTAFKDYTTLIEVPDRGKKTDSSSNEVSEHTHNQSGASLTAGNSPTKNNTMTLSWHAEAYHAGLSSETRKRIQRQFIKGETRVVVATIAFGMGINKANVRAIIHYDMPSSFETYVQEIGRAGRDGKPAQCHMFLDENKTDLYYHQRNIYSSVTDDKNIDKLMGHLFKKCRCQNLQKKEEKEKIDKLNEMDKHQIIGDHKTAFTNTPYEIPAEDVDDLLDDNEHQDETTKDKPVVKYVRESCVAKHRACEGHEVSFPVEETTQDVNLKAETIMTLICKLQEVYPQLRIKQFPPVKSTCDVLCYKGSAQMQAVASSSMPVRIGLQQFLRGQENKEDIPNRISFNAVNIASMLGEPFADTIKKLKQLEWTLVEKTGKFRKSQIRVRFEGNSFFLNRVGDLNEKELEEIRLYLIDYNRLYEKIERKKLNRVFQIFYNHRIPMDKMKDKTTRLETSSRIKEALNSYFAATVPLLTSPTDKKTKTREFDKISQVKELNIRKSARDFIAHNGRNIPPRVIARIFQGISTPNYPAEHWGQNKKYWRIHLDVDFLHLASIIQDEFLK